MSAAAAKTIAEGLNGLAFVACPAAWAEHRTSSALVGVRITPLLLAERIDGKEH